MAMRFKRHERFTALQDAKQAAAAQVQQAVAAVEQRLPGHRPVSWWERPFGKALIALAAVGAAGMAVGALIMRRRAVATPDAFDADVARGLATTRTEAYDAGRAEGDDRVEEAAAESFPASDAPVWGSGPDVPVIREGEHKESLPYPQQ